MLRLNRDTTNLILTWISEGPWHSVCRLCCRSWATKLAANAHRCHPSLPYSVVAAEQNEALLGWLLTHRVPWSSKHIMCFCVRHKQFDPFCWILRYVPRAAATLSLPDRICVTRSLACAGPNALETFQALDDVDPIIKQMKGLFVWTPHLLHWVVQRFGSGCLHPQCLAVLDHCIALCGGWDVESLYVACQYGEIDVIDFLIHHPQAHFSKSLSLFTRALQGCARRRTLGGSTALWELMKRLAPDDVAFPLEVLPIAIKDGQTWLVRCVLSDPQCPIQQSGPEIEATAISVVRFCQGDADIIYLLQELERLGLSWNTPGVLFAAVDRPVTPTVLRWMLQNGSGWWNVETDMLLLRCILAGCNESVQLVVTHVGPSLNVHNTLFTTTAAELGNLALLKYLRQCGCEWDHHCLHMALNNDHMCVARWALSNGCPILSDHNNREDELRTTLMRLV